MALLQGSLRVAAAHSRTMTALGICMAGMDNAYLETWGCMAAWLLR